MGIAQQSTVVPGKQMIAQVTDCLERMSGPEHTVGKQEEYLSRGEGTEN